MRVGSVREGSFHEALNSLERLHERYVEPSSGWMISNIRINGRT